MHAAHQTPAVPPSPVELHERERATRAAMDGINDAVFVKDQYGRYLMVNPATAAIMGRSIDEIIGKGDVEIFGADAAREMREADQRVLASGQAITFEEIVTTAGGGPRHRLTTKTPYRDDAGRVIGVIGISRDITERKEAEAALVASEQRLRFLSESIPHMIWSARPDGYIDYFNQRCLDYTGAKHGQMAGWDWLPLVHPDDRAATIERWAAALRDGSEYKIDYRLRHGQTGQWRWHRGHAMPMRDAEGRILRWYGTCTDIDAQKRVEEELRESEQRLKRAQEIAHLGSWELDLLSNRLTWSDEVYRIFGLQPQEFAATYEAFLEAVHPEDRLAVDAAYSGSLREGRDRYEIEHRVVRKGTGEVRTVHEKCEHIRDGSGRIIRSVGMVHDITERKATEIALRASEERYRFLMESVPQMVWSCDPEGQNVDVNSRWEQYTGQPAEQASSRWVEVVHPEDRPRMSKCWMQALASGEKFECEHRVRRVSDGGYRWHLAQALPMKDEQGRVIGWVGTSTDIHDLKMAQERAETAAAARREGEAEMLRLNRQLQRKLTELETIFEIVPIGIAVAEDAECHVIHGNRTYSQMLGAPLGANLSKTNPESGPLLRYRFLRDGRELAPDELPLQRAAATGTAVANVTFDVERTDGSVLRLVGNAAPLVAADGTTTGVIGAFWDIEDFRRAEERLRMEKDAAVSASIAKDRFLATLSHELRNPLGTILNALQVTEEISTCQDCPVRDHRRIIARQTRHLARLVDDLLDVSRVAAGKITLKRETVDLTRVVRHSVEACHLAFEERRQQITLHLPAEPLLVQGDSARLEQVVLNLLSNAGKYTPSGGQVWLTAMAEGDEAVIRVRDNGIGIPPEALPRLFEPFMQVDESLDRSQGGLGLGLALSRNLVQMQGGSITVSSAGADQGSEFVVRLPRVRSAVKVPPAPATPRKRASHRVLVIEDQADARQVLRRLLELWGHQAEVAVDGLQGVEMAISLRPEVALVDIGLPGINGYEVAQRVRSALGNGIVLIALTGYGQPEDVQKATEAGFDLHLTKPIEPVKLEQLLGGIGPQQ